MDEQKTSVLVVEDSPTQARWLRVLLEQQGYLVKTAVNGKEALRSLAEWTPDVVVTDILMPEMDGFQLCRNLKSDPRYARVPVILLTALSDPMDVMNALKCGADNFVTKPFDPDFLISRVEHSIKNLAGQDDEALVEETETVSFNGSVHELPARLGRVIPLLLSTYEEAVAKNRELQESLDTIRALESDYRSILEANADGILVCDHEGMVQFANPAAAALLGRAPADLVSQRFAPDLQPDTTTEQELTTASGGTIVVEMSVTETLWERRQALLASLRDVTEKVRMRDQLKTMAFDDELTGLRNRRGFTTLANKQLQIARRRGDGAVLFFLDLDGLKWINDNLGHQEGDQAIMDLADILRATFRQTDIVARLGGDEYAVLALDAPQGSADVLAGRMERMIEAHNNTAGRSFTLSASIGWVVWTPDSEEDLETLITRADEVMYEAKRQKKANRGLEPA